MEDSGHLYDDRFTVPGLLAGTGAAAPAEGKAFFSATEVDVDSYDHVIMCMSGGKDSIACLLRLKEAGADMSKVELWHHDVDGNEGSTLMDWLFMRDYVRKFAEAMGLPVYFSWLDGGFEGEMLKENAHGRPHKVETPDGLVTLPRETVRTRPGTRMRFPQVSPSLQTRWCSSALKIDVGRRALNNQARFNGKRVLFVTGERRQESANRARYNQLEAHACDRRGGRTARLVDAWRPVLHWKEDEVWAIIERHRIAAPVPYRLGWSRSSCMTCIYNGARVWATIARHFPERAERIAAYEDRFGVTISRKRVNVLALARTARPFEVEDLEALGQAGSHEYRLPVFLPEDVAWTMPKGAFGKEGCGSE